MRLDLRELLDTPGATIELELARHQIDELGELPLVAPVQGHLRVTNSLQSVLVQGRVEARVALECGRCLTGFDQRLAVKVETTCPLGYFVNGPEDEHFDAELDEEALDFFDTTCLYVDELLRQCLLVELPLAPLCRKECKGLCPSCGIDLNVDRCACNEPTDARWNQLATLLHEQPSSLN